MLPLCFLFGREGYIPSLHRDYDFFSGPQIPLFHFQPYGFLVAVVFTTLWLSRHPGGCDSFGCLDHYGCRDLFSCCDHLGCRDLFFFCHNQFGCLGLDCFCDLSGYRDLLYVTTNLDSANDVGVTTFLAITILYRAASLYVPTNLVVFVVMTFFGIATSFQGRSVWSATIWSSIL